MYNYNILNLYNFNFFFQEKYRYLTIHDDKRNCKQFVHKKHLGKKVVLLT